MMLFAQESAFLLWESWCRFVILTVVIVILYC